MGVLRWLTVIATIAMITVNGLANALPINGKTTGDISDGFEILFTPPGYVFSIWGVIYLGLIAFSIAQALPAYSERPLVRALRPWYLLNTAANASWIFAWHYELFGLSLLIMLAILASLVKINAEIAEHPPRELGLLACVQAPFSLYFGWISIATFANITVVLWDAGVTTPLSDPVVTLMILAAATGIGVFVALRRSDPVYAGVFVWALSGIAVKHAELELLFGGALALAAVCTGVFGWSSVMAWRQRRGTLVA